MQFKGGREDYHDWFENENPFDEILYKMYNYSSAFWPTINNLESIRDGKRIVLLNRIFVQSKTMENIFGFSGNVFLSPLEMITERGFPLLKPFSLLISHMIDAGIMTKLYADFLFNVTVLENIRDRTRIEDTKQIVLTIHHMNGAFTVLFLGLFISFLVFISELLFAWNINRRKTKNYWKLLRYRYKNLITLKKHDELK